MSKSRWHQSLWSSFVSRFARSGRGSRRRSSGQRFGSPAAELLETRLVPTISASFAGTTLTLTNVGGGPDAVRVVEGQASSQIFVNAVLFATISGASTATVNTINFTGGAGGDSLTIEGNSPALNFINLESVETLTVNARPSSGTLTIDADFANDGDHNLDFGTSTIIGNLTVTDVAAVTDTGTLTVQRTSAANSGTLDVTTNGGAAITLNSADNDFGHIRLTTTGTATIVENGETDFGLGATSVGTLILTTTGEVTDTGTLAVTGTTTITSPVRNIILNSVNTFGGALTLTGNNVTINDTDAATVLASVTTNGAINNNNPSGTFNLTADGPVTNTGALNIFGRATITTTADDVTLTGANNFGSISVVGSDDVSINEASATELFTTNPTGTLSVTSTGAVTDSGVITVTGATTISAAGNPITLDSATNNFASTVRFTGSNVTLVDGTGGIILGSGVGASTATGRLNVTSTGGPVTDNGVLTITGDVTVEALGQAIEFNNGTGTFGRFFLQGSDIDISEAAPTDLGSTTATGTLTVVSTGAITNGTIGNYAKLNVVGNTVFTANAGASDITIGTTAPHLSSFGTNGVGTLTLTGNNITVFEGGGTLLGAVDANGFFTLKAIDGVSPASGGVTKAGGTTIDVTGLATIDVGATYDIVLTTGTIHFGSLIFSGNDVSITETSATVLGKRSSTTSTAGNTVYGNLNLTSGGSITHTNPAAVDNTFGKLTVGGIATIQAGAGTDIVLNQIDPTTVLAGSPTANANTFGTLVLTSTGGGDATIIEAGPMNLGAIDITGDLSVTASGPINDSGILQVDLTTTMNAGANPIVLDKNNGAFVPLSQNLLAGAISLTGTNIILKNDLATILGTITATGTLDVASTGAISNPAGVITSTGKATFSITGDNPNVPAAVSLGGGSDTVLGVVSVLGATDVTINESNALDLFTMNPTGNLTIDTGAGAVTDSGRITVGGDTSITTTGAITLDVASNDFDNDLVADGDTFSFTGASTVTIIDSGLGGIDFATSTGGTLTLRSSGPVTDSGTLTIGGGTGAVNITATGAAAAGNITLNSAANTYGTLTLKGTNITIVDAGALSLGNVTSTASTPGLSLTAGGAVTQVPLSSIRAVGPTSITITGAAADITLANAGNVFGGLTITNGDDVVINEAAGTSLAASTAATLAVTSTGAITQTGALTVTGLATFTTGNGTTTGSAITLTNAGNTFGSVVLTGGSMSLVETDASGVDLTATSTGTLTVTAGGAGTIEDVGNLTIKGLATFTAVGDDITLNGSNAFGSIGVTSGANVTINEDGPSTILAGITATGDLSVTAGGSVTDTGTILVTGATTVTATGDPITLDSAGNNFDVDDNAGSDLTFTGSNVTIVDVNEIDLGTSTATGTLTVTTTAGGVTDTGTLTITGTVTINAVGQTISLNSATGILGSAPTAMLLLRAADATIVDNDATGTVIGATTITGPLNVNNNGAGAISQAVPPGNPISTTGLTTLSGTSVTLAGNGVAPGPMNSFGTLVITATTGSASILENAATVLGETNVATNLTIRSTGSITQTALADNIVVGDATTLIAVGQTVNLPNITNSFGNAAADALTITAKDVTIGETGGTVLGTSNITGFLSITTPGGAADDITDTGTVDVMGLTTLNAGAGGSIVIDDDGVVANGGAGTFGKLRLTALDAVVVDSGAIELGTSVIGAGTNGLTLRYGGIVTDAAGEVTTVAGITDIRPIQVAVPINYAVTLNEATSAYTGAVELRGSNLLFVNNAANTVLTDVIASGTVTITANIGTITQVAPGPDLIQAAGLVLLTANGAGGGIGVSSAVPLATAVNTLRLNTVGSAFISETISIDIGQSTIGGAFFLSDLGAGGTGITDSGTITVGTTLTLDTADNITLDQGNSTFNGVLAANGVADLIILNGNNVYVKDNGPLELGAISVNGSLTLVSGQGGADDIVDIAGTAITVLGGPTFFDAGLPATGGAVIINNGIATPGIHTFTGGATGMGSSVTIVP